VNKNPKVSIVLPTYNRAKLIMRALYSIRDQNYNNWELIIVDDGSFDNTKHLIDEFAKTVNQNIIYIYQENRGAGSARNCGISKCSGELIAFIDSDDAWTTNHLKDSVKALIDNPQIDWVCSDLSRIEIKTGRIVVSSNFHADGKKPKFFNLKNYKKGNVNIIKDKRLVRFLLKYGVIGHLPCSVLRKTIFEVLQIRNFRIGEDRLFSIEAAKHGFNFAYIDNIHLHFGVHDSHSTVGKNEETQKYIDVHDELARMYRFIYKNKSFSFLERMLARRALSHEYFWGLAYNGLWLKEERNLSIFYFYKAIKIWPFSFLFWKTFIFCFIRVFLSPEGFQIGPGFKSRARPLIDESNVK